MLHGDITKRMNDQINKEFYSSYFYLAISCYYTAHNLNGFANWFQIQAQEEKDHAMLFVQYLQNNGEEVHLDAIAAASAEFSDFAAPLTATLAHEKYVTQSIHNIYEACLQQKDFRSTQFLDWFIKEQGEEEKNADDLVKRFELFGGDSKGLYLIDSELLTRVYTPASLVL